MINTFFWILSFMLIAAGCFGQAMINENTSLLEAEKLIEESDSYSSPDIGEIKDFNFRKKRFANWAFYTEFGGVVTSHTYPHFTVNLDAIIESKEKHMFNGRLGAGIVLLDEGYEIIVPGYLSFLFGYKNHFETAVGAIFIMGSETGSQVAPAVLVGYRHQHPRGGLIYGLNMNFAFPQREITPNNTDYVLEPWVSVRIGYSW